jgi:hypothetical protein
MCYCVKDGQYKMKRSIVSVVWFRNAIGTGLEDFTKDNVILFISCRPVLQELRKHWVNCRGQPTGLRYQARDWSTWHKHIPKYRALNLMIRFTRNRTWLEAGTLNLMLFRSALNFPIYLRILLGQDVPRFQNVCFSRCLFGLLPSFLHYICACTSSWKLHFVTLFVRCVVLQWVVWLMIWQDFEELRLGGVVTWDHDLSDSVFFLRWF